MAKSETVPHDDGDVDIDAMIRDASVMKAELDKIKQKHIELAASSMCAHKSAYSNIKWANTESRMASGVLLTLTAIGGKEIIQVMIGDGLSDSTIAAIRADIKRSQELQLINLIK